MITFWLTGVFASCRMRLRRGRHRDRLVVRCVEPNVRSKEWAMLDCDRSALFSSDRGRSAVGRSQQGVQNPRSQTHDDSPASRLRYGGQRPHRDKDARPRVRRGHDDIVVRRGSASHLGCRASLLFSSAVSLRLAQEDAGRRERSAVMGSTSASSGPEVGGEDET